jgi:hypothetical protein
MRYFALRIIKWFFYLVAILQIVGGIGLVIQIANAGAVVAPTPAGITQPAAQPQQPISPFGAPQTQPTLAPSPTGTQPPLGAEAPLKPPDITDIQRLFAQNQGWAIIGTILATLIMALLTVAVAQMIGVVIDIADNTHRAAMALEKR